MDVFSPLDPPYERCTDTALSADFVDPPSRFVEPNSDGRLIPELRQAAALRNPYKILARAAAAFFAAQHPTAGSVPADDEERGNALADLSVTGRFAYCLFKTPPLTPLDDFQVGSGVNHIDLGHPPHSPARLLQVIDEELATLVAGTAAERSAAIAPALARAYDVAWALRGPLAQRAAARAPLGWIAVWAEEDMPHRPVNVPAPPYEQYQIPVTVNGITLRTRFFIASPPGGSLPAPAPGPTPRELPPDPLPHVPDGNMVILFLHGHSSGADEALTIIPHLHMAGLVRGVKFSIIAFDFPNNGYSETFDHERVANSAATTWPGGLGLSRTHRDTNHRLHRRLHRRVRRRARADRADQEPFRRRDRRQSRRQHGTASWPADADAVVAEQRDRLVERGVGVGPDGSGSDQESGARRLPEPLERGARRTLRAGATSTRCTRSPSYPLSSQSPQPALWYRNNWEPCKRLHIEGSRTARREVYNRFFRKWHWRVAGEQLIFSHVDRVDHFDSTTQFRYELNTVKHLLVRKR